MAFFAHTAKSLPLWQPLATHLGDVATLAKRFGEESKPWDSNFADLATWSGLLHDLGKYRDEFQRMLERKIERGDERTYHKQAGAEKAVQSNLIPLAFGIFGHHGGIPNKTDLEAGLTTAVRETLQQIWPIALADFPLLASAAPKPPLLRDGFHADLVTRMLFSCLVDADWSDTAAHDRRCKGLPDEPDPPPLDPATRLSRVLTHIESCAQSCKQQEIKRIRADILQACLSTADDAPNLFSLTVPTGGGKTLAGLAFALKHAAKHRLRRVIYVAPYMSILEQNIGVFRSALGIGADAPDLFEHYSLAEPPGGESENDTAREAAARRAENWDAPFIVTTNVQFFESLFSNRPGRCRKLHNIARSVIILDECQTLPPGLVAPTCGMLKQLVAEFGCSIVLCTATQPAFQHETLKPDERLDAFEIIPIELDLFGKLKRVELTWPKVGDNALSWREIAEMMRGETSALCVVNTKKAARAIYDELKTLNTPGLFHLSTAMCPAHRREKLASIRQLLAMGAPCFVVSTQLIEAGVDVDFPFLMRELAPLESIIQAAGRCNREGRITAGGRVVIFRSMGTMPCSQWYKAGRATLENHFLARGVEPQINDPRVIQEYFRRLYHSGALDGHGIRAMRNKLQFRDVSQAYRLIEDAGAPVVVARWARHQTEIARLLEEVRTSPNKAAFRKLARFQVNLYPHQILSSAHLLHEESPGVLVWDGGYDDEAGIVDEIADEFII